MKIIVKYNLEIITGILFLVGVLTLILWQNLSLTRKLTAGFMLVYIAHEWEECRIPGGFHKLFFGRMGIEPKKDTETMHLPVAVYLLVILLVTWFFDSIRTFILVPICLSLFEGVIHTVGIKLMKMTRPYTPGMCTAWIAFAYAVFSIMQLNKTKPVTGIQWIAGIALSVKTFIIMQRCFIGVAGYSYRELIPIAKKKIFGR